MTVAVDEVAEFSARADALLVNLGTMDPARTMAIYKAVETVSSAKIPFVLDPVFVEASRTRLALARELAGLHPAIIRANDTEAASLFDWYNNHEKGDFKTLASQVTDCAVITGTEDVLFSAAEMVRIDNGSELMAKITAMGCSLTALMAALVAVEDDRLVAACAALLWFNIAGELASEKSPGPGSFVPNFIDALANMDEETLMQRAKIK